MGYRSQIRSCIYSDNHELFDSFISAQKLVDNQVFHEASDTEASGFANSLTFLEKIWEYAQPSITGETKQVVKILDLDGQDWKWYTEYADVKAWHKLLLDAEDAGLNYEFVRVGEEDGDIEYESGGDNVENFLSTYTHINVDYGD